MIHAKSDGLSVVPSVIDLIDQDELLLLEQRLKFVLDDATSDFDTCTIACSPVMKRLAFNVYLAASGSDMIVIPVKLDSDEEACFRRAVLLYASLSARFPLPFEGRAERFGDRQAELENQLPPMAPALCPQGLPWDIARSVHLMASCTARTPLGCDQMRTFWRRPPVPRRKPASSVSLWAQCEGQPSIR